MKKNDFTPEYIRSKVLDYICNHHFPHDELDEIGSRVCITGLSDVEINSVTKSESTFIVDGTATVETETDLGEGDAWGDGYPMTFRYEFDEDGRIVRQHSRHIDTSSFFAGSDELDTYLIEATSSEHLAVFQSSIVDIRSLLEDGLGASRKCLHRLLFVNVITALECYLSDFFISRIRAERSLLRRLVETTPTFREQKITVSDVFQTMEAIEKRANTFLAGLVWHRLDRVRLLYERVFEVTFPSDVKALSEAILIRHELVHRNGKKPDGTEHEISEADIEMVITAAEELVRHIEKKWRERPGG